MKRFLLATVLLLAFARLSSAAPTLKSHSDEIHATFEVSRTSKPVPLLTEDRGLRISRKPTSVPLPTVFNERGLVVDIKRRAVSSALSNHLYLNKGRNGNQIRRRFQLPVFVRQSGLTADPCKSSSQCAGTRVCSTREAAGSRRCVPVRGFKDCTNDTGCVTGEACVTINETGRNVCVSQRAIDNIGTPRKSSDGGFTGDKCTSNKDCAGTRVCRDFANEMRCIPNLGLKRCRDGEDCPLESCQTIFEGGETFCTSEGFAIEVEANVTVQVSGPDATTPPPEAPTTQRPTTESMTGTESSATTEKMTTDVPSSRPPATTPPPTEASSTQSSSGTTGSSNTPVSGNEPDENEVGDVPNEDTTNEPCIGIHSLNYLPRDQLVFEKDRLARVLCDMNESCATPGHMVRYRRSGMMMKSYCEIDGGCVERVMFVNSPRYSRGLTVESGSEYLVFTAFSARYVTRAEEGALSVAIRLGF